jgi:hypothetical protein
MVHMTANDMKTKMSQKIPLSLSLSLSLSLTHTHTHTHISQSSSSQTSCHLQFHLASKPQEQQFLLETELVTKQEK